jgi:hypothetical protein
MKTFRGIRYITGHGSFPIVVKADSEKEAYDIAYDLVPLPRWEDVEWDYNGMDFEEIELEEVEDAPL